MDAAISGFSLDPRRSGWDLLLFITEGIIRHPATMARTIMVRLGSGSPVTGKTDGLRLAGTESGLQATGNTADESTKGTVGLIPVPFVFVIVMSVVSRPISSIVQRTEELDLRSKT